MARIQLKTLQKKFQNDILRQCFTKPSLLPWIKASAISPKRRLAVYQDDYRLRFSEFLEIDFPKTKKFLGTRLFKKCCTDYILKCPSTTRNVNFYGEHFPKFIKNSAWGKNNKLLQDLVEVEWQFAQFYFFSDVEYLIKEKLATLDPEKLDSLFLSVIPALSFLESNFDLSKKNLKNLRKTKQPLYFLIYRKNFDCVLEKVSKEEFFALKKIQAGKNLDQVLESLYRQFKFKDLQQWQSWFIKWVSSGILYDLCVPA